jgi:hypothetical protein
MNFDWALPSDQRCPSRPGRPLSFVRIILIVLANRGKSFLTEAVRCRTFDEAFAPIE